MNVHSRRTAAQHQADNDPSDRIMTLQSRVSSHPGSEERSVEILEKLRPVFVQKGFDGASMQDLARAADMSVGNFYRYFPSKAAIVEAMIGVDLSELQAMFALIVQSSDPMQGLRHAIRMRVTEQDCDGEGELWAEITAAATRKADIGRAARRMEDAVVENLCLVFAATTGLALAEAQERYRARAELILMLVKGTAMRHTAPVAAAPPMTSPTTSPTTSPVAPPLAPPAPDDLTQLVLRMIDTILDEITGGPSDQNPKVPAHA